MLGLIGTVGGVIKGAYWLLGAYGNSNTLLSLIASAENGNWFASALLWITRVPWEVYWVSALVFLGLALLLGHWQPWHRKDTIESRASIPQRRAPPLDLPPNPSLSDMMIPPSHLPLLLQARLDIEKLAAQALEPTATPDKESRSAVVGAPRLNIRAAKMAALDLAAEISRFTGLRKIARPKIDSGRKNAFEFSGMMLDLTRTQDADRETLKQYREKFASRVSDLYERLISEHPHDKDTTLDRLCVKGPQRVPDIDNIVEYLSYLSR